ncbi:hypothetical protein Tco_0601316, partial [Tanacetum coccineum]
VVAWIDFLMLNGSLLCRWGFMEDLVRFRGKVIDYNGSSTVVWDHRILSGLFLFGDYPTVILYFCGFDPEDFTLLPVFFICSYVVEDGHSVASPMVLWLGSLFGFRISDSPDEMFHGAYCTATSYSLHFITRFLSFLILLMDHHRRPLVLLPCSIGARRMVNSTSSSSLPFHIVCDLSRQVDSSRLDSSDRGDIPCWSTVSALLNGRSLSDLRRSFFGFWSDRSSFWIYDRMYHKIVLPLRRA